MRVVGCDRSKSLAYVSAELFTPSLLGAPPPHRNERVPGMNVFLEIPLNRNDSGAGECLGWGVQQFSDVLFNLFANSLILQCLEQSMLFNVGKSAAKGAFHNVVVNHGSLNFED